jgi:hypothetical protein
VVMRSSAVIRVFVLASLGAVVGALLFGLSFGFSGTGTALGMGMQSVATMGSPTTPLRLPDRARVPLEETERCGTPAIIEILTTWDTLTLQEKSALKWVLFRPTDPAGGIDGDQHLLPSLYETAHFVVHYTTGSDGGDSADAPDLTDGNTNSVPDYIETYASYFETSYSTEVTGKGFNAPPSDAGQPPNDANDRNPNGKYDVFVYDLGSGLYGYANPEDWPTTPSRSFIGVNKDYSWAPPNDDPEGDAKGAMKVTAAHEYHHAIQFGYDVQEERWWMETTSVYMEDEVFPVVNDNYNYLPPWFEWSDAYGLTTFDGTHEYGNFIWAKRLSEDFSDDVVREIWVEDQTTDGLTAIDNVLGSHGSGLVSEFNRFARSNFFLEQLYADGAGYRAAVAATTFSGVWLEYQYDYGTDGLPFTIDSTDVNWDAWMDAWAADYVTLALDASVLQYRVSFDGLDNAVNYQVSLWTRKGGAFVQYPFVLDGGKDGSVDVPYDTYDGVALVIGRAGAGGGAGPLWEVTIAAAPPALPVGGVAVLPDVSGSAGRNYLGLAVLAAAALVALSAGAWHARGRGLR